MAFFKVNHCDIFVSFGNTELIHALCSPELKPSQRRRTLLYGPETSALVTD